MQETAHKKRKIIYAITKAEPFGGAQKYVWTMATTLAEKMGDKYDVSVISGRGETLVQKLTEKNIKTFIIPSLGRDIFILDDIKSFFALLKILKREKPDVLHLNSSKMGGLGGLAGRLAGVPKIIFTLHAIFSNEDRPFIIKKITLFLHWLSIIFSHKTIAVSRKTKNDIDSLPFIKDKVFVVHSGIEEEVFEPKFSAQKILCDKAGTESTEIIIGTISELHKNKGLDFLIEACKSLPINASVYIIGEGEERQNLTKQIQKNGLTERVFLVGKIADARKLLKAFDIFTLTSRTEALPYTILEAGLAGNAVIASRVGGIPEIIENGKSGILTSVGDVEEIKRALKFLINKKEKREEFGTHLRETVLKNFSLEDMIHRTEKFY